MNGLNTLILLFFITLITTAITNVFIKSQIEVGDQHPKYRYNHFQQTNDLGRILGGEPAYLHEFPYIVSLRSQFQTHICTGVLISPIWVLTAAHCVRSPVDSIQYGVETIFAEPANHDSIIAVNKSIMHEYYTKNPTRNDVGVIRLTKSINFGKFVRRAILPPPDYYVPGGTMAVAAGWGNTETGYPSQYLLKVIIKVTNLLTCRIFYKVDFRNICAGKRGKGGCRGDSGGPLIVDGKVVGLTSYGKTNCRRSRGGVYTKVSSFLNWIRRNTGVNI